MSKKRIINTLKRKSECWKTIKRAEFITPKEKGWLFNKLSTEIRQLRGILNAIH